MPFFFRLCTVGLLALSLGLTACDSSEDEEGEEGEDTDYAIGCDDPEAITIPIPPTATYLRTAPSDNAPPTQPVRLSDVGLQPGDRIRVERLGEFQWRALQHPDSVLYGVVAVFSSDDVLLDRSERARIPGAIDVGRDYVTRPSYRDGRATDIPEDFGVSFEVDTLTVPAGAAFIFASPDDSTFEDNGDEDEDFRLCITTVES